MSTLFINVTALLMDEDFTTLRDGFVSVEGGRISYVGPSRPEGRYDEIIDCAGQVMLPGFVNAHTHVPMTLMRGYGGGHELQSWLKDWIFPAEAKLDERAVDAGARLGLAEMIASGVTCIADMYMHTPVIARAVLDAGISANLSVGGVYFDAPEDFSPERCGDCKNQRELTEGFHGADGGRVLTDASIHAEYTSSAPLWRWMAEYAQTHGLRMHAHISETASEHADSLSRNGLTPIRALGEWGAWENGGIAAHCVYTTPEDWAYMHEKGVAAVHNPWSNLKLGSGVAPVPDLLAAGVNVALGTDGMSSHNAMDFFSDMKLSVCLQNGVRRDALSLSARQALEMATANGARALGRTDTGRIAGGFWADLILVNFDALGLIPCHDEAENLVYAANAAHVSMNMARGRVIYKNGEFLTLDLPKIRQEVRSYALPLLFGERG